MECGESILPKLCAIRGVRTLSDLTHRAVLCCYVNVYHCGVTTEMTIEVCLVEARDQ